MKKYINWILMLLVFTSCDDFLDETPEAYRTPQGFFETVQEIDQAVAGIYVSNRSLYTEQLQLRFGESRSDNTNIESTGDSGGIDDDELNEFTMQANNSRIGNYWSTNYQGISRANFVLANINRPDYPTVEAKNFREGEALFFRTWFHFNLVRVFGDIPYVTKAGETPEEIRSEEFLIRDPADEVYASLLVDADKVISLLPTPSAIKADDKGRATKGAALMLKAKIHMAQQQYQQAIPLLEQITTLGYGLLPNYVDVFKTKNHIENIFEIQNSFSLGQTIDLFTNFVPSVSGEEILGVGSTPNNRGNQFRPTQDLIDLYVDGDARKDHNISVYTDNVGNTYNWASKFAFPFVEPGEQDINVPMFRYADALLMLAECYAEAGGGDPATIIVTIRTRAGITNPALSAAELADITKTIADERRRELAFEGHRFFDLLRRNELVSVMTAHGAQQVADGLTVTANAYQNIRVLVGIPQGQVDQFGFQQTDGW